MRSREQIVGDAPALEELEKSIVIFLVYLFDGSALLIRRKCDGCAV
jgi:hypothetical protein